VKNIQIKFYLTEETGSDRTDAFKIGFGFFDVIISIFLLFSWPAVFYLIYNLFRLES
jgi:hypothetical protein